MGLFFHIPFVEPGNNGRAYTGPGKSLFRDVGDIPSPHPIFSKVAGKDRVPFR